MVPHSRFPEPAAIARSNAAFWRRAWPHALRARGQRLGVEMTTLLLRYASARLFFARWALVHGLAETAEESAAAVAALRTAALIATFDEHQRGLGVRYHLSEMPRLAARIRRLAREYRAGDVTAEQVRRALGADVSGGAEPPR